MARLLIAAMPVLVGGLVVAYSAVSHTAGAAEGEPSKYVPVSPHRRVDTRTGDGVNRAGDNTLRVQVAGRNGVPGDASAVVVTVVATNGASPGFVSAYPTGTKRPLASIINYAPGLTYSTESIVPLGDDGSFDIYTLTDVDIVVDVTGAFVTANGSKGGRFVADAPTRILDTRRGEAMQRRETRTVELPAGLPADTSAVVVTLTSTSPNRPGYFTAFPSGPLPDTSTLNVSTFDSTRASTAIVQVDDGEFQVYSSHGGELIVDLVGHFTGESAAWSSDGMYVPMTPTRQLDTRLSRPLEGGETRGFPASGAGTVVGSLAMIMPSNIGYGAVFGNGTEYAGTSSINLSDVPLIANMALSRTTDAGVALYSSTKADYLFDQYGYFTTGRARITENVAPTVPTTSSTTTTTVPFSGGGSGGAGCSVSAILVPSCGAWLGSSVPDSNGGYDFMQGIAEYEAVARNEPDIVHVYKSGGGAFPSRGDREVSERPGHQRSILLINWKPSMSHTWRQIADGAADANIQSVANGIKAYPYKFFLTIWHEPENEVGRSGKTAADYVDMYRHVVQELRSLGVTNAVFVWNMMGSTNHSEMYDDLYPGHDVVDWIGYDPYGQEKVDSMSYLVNRPNENTGWPGFYTWATRKAPGKPIMLSEWGFNLKVNDYGPAALRVGAAEMKNGFPMLKAFVYWNQNADFTPRLGQDAEYDAAYRQFAADPYFNSTSTAAAP